MKLVTSLQISEAMPWLRCWIEPTLKRQAVKPPCSPQPNSVCFALLYLEHAVKEILLSRLQVIDNTRANLQVLLIPPLLSTGYNELDLLFVLVLPHTWMHRNIKQIWCWRNVNYKVWKYCIIIAHGWLCNPKVASWKHVKTKKTTIYGFYHDYKKIGKVTVIVVLCAKLNQSKSRISELQ